MSGISSGIGLISGIDIASLIDSLITLESRGKVRLQSRLALLQQQSAAMLDINSRLLNLKTTAGGLRLNSIFDSIIATSSNASLLTATGTGSAHVGEAVRKRKASVYICCASSSAWTADCMFSTA